MGNPAVYPTAGVGAKGMYSQDLLVSVSSLAIQGRAAVALALVQKEQQVALFPSLLPEDSPMWLPGTVRQQSEARCIGFASQLCQLLAEWTWLSHFVDLSIPICKMGFH